MTEKEIMDFKIECLRLASGLSQHGRDIRTTVEIYKDLLEALNLK